MTVKEAIDDIKPILRDMRRDEREMIAEGNTDAANVIRHDRQAICEQIVMGEYE